MAVVKRSTRSTLEELRTPCFPPNPTCTPKKKNEFFFKEKTEKKPQRRGKGSKDRKKVDIFFCV